MNNGISKILAIDPGTRHMGVAYLEKGKLVYYGVLNFKKGDKTPQERLQEGRKAILRLIRYYQPQILAIEKTFFAKNRNASLLNVLSDEIQAVGKRKGLDVKSFAPSTVKKFITGNGWASKDEVARVIITRFPHLRIYITQDRKWKVQYHQNMFDAVAIGLTGMDEENGGQERK